jgi:type III secretion protein W
MLLEESPREIRAGINAAAESRAFARRSRKRRPRLARELRQTYRQFLASEDHATVQYEEWFDDYGFDDRHLVLDFLEHAVSADMYSLDPSCSRLEFGNILRRVRELCTLRSADGILLRQAWDEKIMQGIQLGQEALLRALFKVVRNGGSMRPLFDGAFAGARLTLDNDCKGRLLRRVTGALRALPRELWRHEDYLTDAIAGLDHLADRLHRAERKNEPERVAVTLR